MSTQIHLPFSWSGEGASSLNYLTRYLREWQGASAIDFSSALIQRTGQHHWDICLCWQWISLRTWLCGELWKESIYTKLLSPLFALLPAIWRKKTCLVTIFIYTKKKQQAELTLRTSCMFCLRLLPKKHCSAWCVPRLRVIVAFARKRCLECCIAHREVVLARPERQGSFITGVGSLESGNTLPVPKKSPWQKNTFSVLTSLQLLP